VSLILEAPDSIPKKRTPSFRFHLEYTLKCGQIFRWQKNSGGYVGFVDGFPLYLSQQDTKFTIFPQGDFEAKIGWFLRLDDPLESIVQEWEGDPVLSEAARIFEGLRLTRQNPWICLAGFVLSIVSNIPKIESSLEKIARHAGEPVQFMNQTLYHFPKPEHIARMRESTLRRFGIGFRAKYLRGCAKAIAEGFPLETLRSKPYEEAKAALMSLPGIGEKVADCILLYSLDHVEAFPVDVWMKRILEHFYFRGRQKSEKYLSEWGRDHFGKWAGYAQQYLYTYGRMKLDRQSPFRNLYSGSIASTNFSSNSRSAFSI